MKQISMFLSLLFAVVCSSGNLQAAPAAPDTLNHYIIDNIPVDQFDGSQLEGKKIVSYRLSTVTSSSNEPVRIHRIRTDGKSQPAEPVYVIDGKQVSKKKYEKLDPSSIKRITVAKNGQPKEVRQYPGWENGVILVETKEDEPVADNRDLRVNIGYGTANSHNLSYSVSSVKPDDNEKYTNMYDYLRGKVAGVIVKTDNSIVIRGVGTLNASEEPLILVDGMETTDLSLLDPRDVYSVDVLKDASTSIYGLRGANGVILITTKVGKQAKSQTAR